MTATKQSIVHADDDADDLELLQKSLERYQQNLEVKSFRNGKTALFYLQNLSQPNDLPSLIVLDINMPGMGGKELLPLLRQLPQYYHTPIVLLTTSNAPCDKDFAAEYRAGFLTKPMLYSQANAMADALLTHFVDDNRKQLIYIIGFKKLTCIYKSSALR